MAVIERFEDIEAWQRARELTREIYHATSTGHLSHEFSLKDQMRRAAVSIMANIAEGFERGGNREFVQFPAHAKGSVGETRSHLYAALDARLIDRATVDRLSGMALDVSRLIAGFMRYPRQSSLRGSKYTPGRGAKS